MPDRLSQAVLNLDERRKEYNDRLLDVTYIEAFCRSAKPGTTGIPLFRLICQLFF